MNVYNKKGDNLFTFKYYNQNGKYGKKAIVNHFGTWNNLLLMLNIPITKEIEHLSKQDIFNVIKKVWIELKRQPTLYEFEKYGKHTKKIIAKNFGTWNNALSQFCEYQKLLGESTFDADTPYNHKTNRVPSAQLRLKVLKRDNYRCVKCGRSPANTPNLELHVDHILAYSKGGETTLKNLQTLCQDCNLGKSDLDD